jgi:phosphoribosylformylglycinamidine synthase
MLVPALLVFADSGRQIDHLYAPADERPPMKARVTVTLKSGILDPQGKAIEGALKSLGVSGVASVRQGKVFDIELEGADTAKAEAALKAAAEKLLANTVIENYRVEVL